MSIKEAMQGKFNPTLSFDGVAIIIACVTCCFWFGSLSQRMNHQEATLTDHSNTLRILGEGQRQTAQNLAVLQQMVSDNVRSK